MSLKLNQSQTIDTRVSSNKKTLNSLTSKKKEKQESKVLPPVIFSFFSGAGFLDLGFEKSGYEIGYVNEFHKPFIEGYKYSRKKMGLPDPTYGFFEGDIKSCLEGDENVRLTNLVGTTKRMGQLVGFIGGPPCPDFSVGGKNKGQHGENGILSKTYIDLICQQRPDFFVFENVKGLYRTSRHREFFEGLKAQLKLNGYACTEKLINAIEYGAPQDRERIILFGVQRQSIDVDVTEFDWNLGIKHKDSKSLPWPEAQPVKKSTTKPEEVPLELTIQYWFEKNKVDQHPNAKHQFTPRAGLAKFETVHEGDDKKKSYKRLHRWRYSPTAAYGNNEVHIHPYLPRRISVAEALAIQSLPKEFALPPDMTLSNMFKTVGNGVPFLAAKGLANAIKDFLNKA